MPWKPMLAPNDELPADFKIPFPILASTKLDGIRATMQEQVLSRSLKPLPNKYMQKSFSLPELRDLDGEMILGDPTAPNVFRATSSAIMTVKFEPKFTYYAFDHYAKAPFLERFEMAREKVKAIGRDDVVLVDHGLIKNQEELDALEAYIVTKLGYEGIMLRDPNGPYKEGRATLDQGWLLKLKRFKNGECIILGFEELMSNQNIAGTNELGRTHRSSAKSGLVPADTLGALIVRDLVTGIEFNVGSGFDATERKKIWTKREQAIGKMVCYKYFPSGGKDKPRHPTFKGFRDPMDMGE